MLPIRERNLTSQRQSHGRVPTYGSGALQRWINSGGPGEKWRGSREFSKGGRKSRSGRSPGGASSDSKTNAPVRQEILGKIVVSMTISPKQFMSFIWIVASRLARPFGA